MQIAHYSRLSVRRYTYPYTIFNGLSGKAVAKRPRARFSCCTMTTNLGETFREGGRFHSARLSCTNIHNPCPKVRKRSVLREHQRPRRAGEVEELYDTTDASNPWWKYPVTGDENETDQFGGTSAAYNRGALALAALRSTVGDAKFREIEKTWVQEHQEQFDPTGLKITATYSDKSTKAIDAAERRVQPAVQDRRQHGSDHSPGGTRTADGRRQRGPVWLFAAWLRRERSLWGNAVAVLATSMMTVVIASCGERVTGLLDGLREGVDFSSHQGAGAGDVSVAGDADRGSLGAVGRAEGGVDGRDRFRADAVWLGAVRQNDDSRIREAILLGGLMGVARGACHHRVRRQYVAGCRRGRPADAVSGDTAAIPRATTAETDDRRRHRSDVPATGVHSGHHHLSSPGIAAIRLPFLSDSLPDHSPISEAADGTLAG